MGRVQRRNTSTGVRPPSRRAARTSTGPSPCPVYVDYLIYGIPIETYNGRTSINQPPLPLPPPSP